MLILDQITVQTIVSGVLETIMTAGTKYLGPQVSQKFQKSRSESQKLEEYVKLVTNRISYFTAYRPNLQYIDDVYVTPVVLDTALTESFVQPEAYEEFMKGLVQDIGLRIRSPRSASGGGSNEVNLSGLSKQQPQLDIHLIQTDQ